MTTSPDRDETRRFDRRQLLRWTAAGAALSAHAAVGGKLLAEEPKSIAASALDKIVVGVMGVNGRGGALAKGFATQPGCEVAYVCDVDSRAVEKTVALLAGVQTRKPVGVGDFRRLLDDESVDALVVAAPDHWHAPATILGCAAGKHVYVEKPLSHNAREGELAVEAAAKHKRVVQLGTQRRSWPAIIEGLEKVRSGAIGKTHYSRSWYNNRRPSIKKGAEIPPPSHLDYALWQGPAPERPYRDNLIHYNWHWFWHWGTGELGNNGVHALDLCRWGLNVDYPIRVTSAGGKHRHDDDQETPDTHVVTFEFPGAAITWEGLSWSPYGPGGAMFGASFHGTEGTLVITDGGYTIYDPRNNKVDAKSGSAGDGEHLTDFLACVRSGATPRADVLNAHKTTLLCHLGNIAHRVGRTLNTDPKTGRVQNDPEAERLWSREYRDGWTPVV